MPILLVNVAHPAIGSRIPDDHLPPLGLLAIGGPLIDDGHAVRLIDGDRVAAPAADLVAEAVAWAARRAVRSLRLDVGPPGHHRRGRVIACLLPQVAIVYGGVYPTYHWREVLDAEPYVTAIVRGEGEETARRLMAAIEAGRPLGDIDGIAFRDTSGPRATRAAAVIADLDAYRVGWELDRPRALQLLGRQARRHRAVLARLPASEPSRPDRGFWNPLAPSQSRAVRS